MGLALRNVGPHDNSVFIVHECWDLEEDGRATVFKISHHRRLVVDEGLNRLWQLQRAVVAGKHLDKGTPENCRSIYSWQY